MLHLNYKNCLGVESVLNRVLRIMPVVCRRKHGDTSSNPGLIAFHIALIPLGNV